MVLSTPARASSRMPGWLMAGCLGIGVTLLVRLSDWTFPQWLEGDPLEIYARVKLAREYPLEWFWNTGHIEPLGAPGPGDWRDYPLPDRIVFWLAGLLSRPLGIVHAVQWMSGALIGLSAASFYLSARWLRCRWEWAAGLAVVFACANYNLRWGLTMSLGQTFLLPPLVLLCARAVRPAPAPRSRHTWLWLGSFVGAILGLGNPYHVYFAGVVSVGALALAWARRVPRQRMLPLILLLGVMSAVFATQHATYLLRLLEGTANEALVRSLGDMRTYALRPLDWLVPPNDHRVAALGSWGARYQEWHRSQGEFFYNYLGALGVMGLLLLLVQAIRRARRRHWLRLDTAFGLAWITAFSVVGGLNYWIGVAGLDLFRASNRIGIYAHVLVYLLLCGWLSRRSRGLPKWTSVALAAGLGAAACWEATLPLADRGYEINNARRWQHYERLTQRIEQSVPPSSAIFQLPALPFPEAGRRHQLPDYEHLLPFLTSRQLHFSYGSLRHDPKLRWARHLESGPVSEMILALEAAGFGALWIDERGYADSARRLLARLDGIGLKPMAPDEALPYLHVFLLRPAPHPRLPDLDDPRLADPWREQAPDPAPIRLLALRGWYQSETHGEASWRWAAREGTLGLWCDEPHPAATLQFKVEAPAGQHVVLLQADQEIWRGKPGPSRQQLTVSLKPGLNSLVWRLVGSTFRPGGHDPRELGFMVENLTVSVP